MTIPAANKSTIIRGWILIVLGSFLTLGMGGMTVWFAGAVNNVTSQGPRWTGSHTMTLQVSELFAVLILFGLVTTAGGLFQVRRGRLSKLVFAIMLVLVAVMFYLGKGIIAANPTR